MAAGVYYVDDGGDGSQANDSTGSWATADTSVFDLNTLVTSYESGDVVYFGHDSVDPKAYGGALTITGPTSGDPALFISATQGSNPVTYAASATDQIQTTDGSYDIVFSGIFSIIGLQIASGRHINLHSPASYWQASKDIVFKLGANGGLSLGGAITTKVSIEDCIIDLSADGTTTRAGAVINIYGAVDISRIGFTNPGYRTGVIIAANTAPSHIVGNITADFSGFTNGTTCEIYSASLSNGRINFNNCKTIANPVFFDTTYPRAGGECWFYNCGPDDSRTDLAGRTYNGTLISSSIYRSSGASIASTGFSWLITTDGNATCSEQTPFKSPWIYGDLASTGSKTFDLYITNDTADFTDAEVWLEVEASSETDEQTWTRVSDTRVTILTTAAAQTDDTTSTWNGAGPSYTYKQKLSVTATVAETGIYRARVAVGVSGIASSRYLHIDPKVTVS